MKNIKSGRIYSVVFGILMVVIISSEFVAQQIIEAQMYSSGVISLAIRQRMISQKIAKYAWKIKAHDAEMFDDDFDKLQEFADRWENNHIKLINGEKANGFGHQNSPTITRLYEKKDPHFKQILSASRSLLTFPDSVDVQKSVQEILNHEQFFLIISDQIVQQYEKENDDKVNQLKITGLITTSLALLMLALIGYVTYRTQRLKKEELKQLNDRLTDSNNELSSANNGLKYLNDKMSDIKKKLEIVFDSTTQSFILLDENGRISFFNQKAKSMIRLAQGITIEEEMTIYEVIPKAFLTEFQEYIAHSFEGEAITVEKKLMTLYDKVFWAEYRLVPVYGEDRKIEGILFNISDINDRKEAEKALSESEEKYRSLFQHMATGFALLDYEMDETDTPQITIREVNPAFEKMLNVPSNAAEGLKLQDVFSYVDFDEPPYDKAIKEVLRGMSHQFEIYSDRLERHFELLIYSPRKGQVAILIRDITVRKNTEEALKDSEAQYNTVISNIPDTDVFMFDHDMKFVLARGTEMLKNHKTPMDYEGFEMKKVLKPHSSAILEPYFKKALEGETNREDTIFENQWYQIQTVPLKHDDGEVYAGLFIAQNIHDKREATEEIKQMNEEMFSINNQLQESQQRLMVAQENTKKIYKITSNISGNLHEQIKYALQTLTQIYDLDIAIISKIDKEIYSVVDFYATMPDSGMEIGMEFEFAHTYCDITYRQDDIVSIHNMGESPYKGHPCYKMFQLESYIGIPIWVKGERYGTLNFSSAKSRAPFSQYEKEYVFILAQWISGLLTRIETENEVQNANTQLQFSQNELKASNEELRASEEELMSYNDNLQAQQEALKTLNNELETQKLALDESAIVVIMDIKGDITYVNHKACELSKYSEEELIGQNLNILNSGHHPQEFFTKMWKTITKKPWRADIKNKAKDGSFYWVDTTIVPFFDENQKPYQYLAIRFDITKKKEAEERLKENQEFLNATQEMAKVGSWEIELEKQVVRWSKGLCSIAGVSENYQPTLEENIGFYHEHDLPVLTQATDKAIATGEPYEVKVRYYNAQKEMLWVREIGHPVYENGKIVRLWGTSQDITSEVEYLEQIEENAHFLNATQEVAKVGGWELDLENNTVKWTKGTYQISEVADDYVPTLDGGIDFYHPDDASIITEATAQTIETGTPFDIKVRYITAKKNQIWVRSIGHAVQEKGKTVKLWGTFQDITEEINHLQTIQENEGFLNATQEAAKVGGWSIDLEKDSVEWTIGTCRIAEVPENYKPDTKTLLNFYHPDDVSIISEIVATAIKTGKPYDVKLRSITAKNNNIWIRAIGNAVQKNGRTVKLWGTFQDITEEITSLKHIQKSEARQKTLLDAIPDMMVRWNKDGVYLDMKAEYNETVVPFDKSKIIGTTIDDKPFSDKTKNRIKENIQKALETGMLQTFDFEAIHLDKSIRIHEARVMKSDENEVIAIIRNVTSKKENERQLKEMLVQLKESAKDRKTLLDAIPDMMFRMDAEGKYLDFKAEEGEILIPAEQVIGSSLQNTPFTEEVKSQIIETLRTTIRENKLQSLDYEVIHPVKGKQMYEARMVKSGHNEAIAMVRNVTEQKEAQKRIQEMSDRLNLATDIAQIGIWQFSIQTQELIGDAKIHQMYEIENLSEIEGFPWEKKIHPEDDKKLEQLYNHCIINQKTECETNFRVVRSNGETRYLEMMSEIFYDEKNKPTHIVGVNRDITLRTNALIQAQKMSERLGVATKSAKIGIWEYRHETDMLIWDDQMFHIFGLENHGQTLRHETWKDCLITADQEKMQEKLSEVYAKQQNLEEEFRIFRKGETRHIKTFANIEYDENGNPQRMIGVNWDITTTKKAEYHILEQNQELLTTGEEMRTLNEALEESHTKIRHSLQQEKATTGVLAKTIKKLKETQSHLVQSEKMAGLGQLTAGIAHEINNPVNFISGGVFALRQNYKDIKEMIQKYRDAEMKITDKKLVEELQNFEEQIDLDFLLEETEGLVTDIKTGADRTAEIVKGLRTFARLDEDALKKINIHENLDVTLVILNSQLKHRVEVIKNYSKNLPLVECFAGKINQVFMNILVNASQAIADKGTITITTTKLHRNNNDYILISMKDTGHGMDKETQNRIFDPFFTTKDVGKGTGLGLSISHGIIEEHHGTIEVRSAIGKGTDFIITLPLKHNNK